MILILGVTASGKGRLAFDLAKSLNGEILSIDSMKVYRRMDIGTAKPPKEARQQIPYHLIDLVEPSDSFNVARFLELADNAIQQIKQKGKNIIAVGGTALYIKALLYGLFDGPGADPQIRAELKARAETDGLEPLHEELKKVDPDSASRVSPNDAKRIIRALEVFKLTGKPISVFQTQWPQEQSHNWTIIGLRREKTEESKRINARVKRMIDAGLVDEVKRLLTEDKPLSDQARCAIGYAEIIDHLSAARLPQLGGPEANGGAGGETSPLGGAGRTTLDDAVELIKKNTRKLAKAQRTWFKTFKDVCWLNLAADEPADQILTRTKHLLENALLR